MAKKTVLDQLAKEMVGDGKLPDLYFVTVRGIVMAVCREIADAMSIAKEYLRNVVVIEDRKVGQYWPR